MRETCCGVDHTSKSPSRRAVIGGLAGVAVLPAAARAQFAPNTADDVKFMQFAIEEARRGGIEAADAPIPDRKSVV